MNEELIWAAGFIDGEGCFHCSITKEGKLQRQLILSVHQTDLRPLEKLQALLGGSIRVVYEDHGKNKKKWEWRLHNAEVVCAAFEQLQPHLVIKQDQFYEQFGRYLQFEIDNPDWGYDRWGTPRYRMVS